MSSSVHSMVFVFGINLIVLLLLLNILLSACAAASAATLDVCLSSQMM